MKKIEKKEVNQQKETIGQEKKKGKNIFIIIGGVIALIIIIIGIIIWRVNDDVEIVDNKKIDVSKIKLSMSDDYKYFNNTIEEFSAVIIDDFKKNNIGVSSSGKCGGEFSEYGDHCFVIVLDSSERIYIVGNDDKYFEWIFINGSIEKGSINKFVDSATVLGRIARLYIKNLDGENGDKFFDEINGTFWSSDNLERVKGINYVYSHMKFEWERDDNTYKITISVSEYENQDDYKETAEYIDSYNDAIKSSAEREIAAKIDDSHVLDSYDVNLTTGLSDVKIKYIIPELSKYVCASDAQSMAKSLVGSTSIGSLQFECVNSEGTFYYVKIDNINSINVDDINANTSFFNKNYKQEDTNLDNLKAQIVIDYKNACASYKYKDVLRNPDNYIGKKAYWFGEVLQVVDRTSYSATYRVGVSCTKYQYIGGYSCPDAIYVTYYGDGNFIEDDMVKMYGTMDGTQSYTTVMGANMTVPRFNATYIELQ